MVQDQLANKERYSKAPELALWATENEGDGRAYSDPFEPKSRFPSVTTVLKLVEKSALVGWAARKVAEKAIERWMDMGRDPEQIMKWLPFAHNAYRDDRGWVGSGLHAAIDADCKGEWFVHELNDEQKAMFAQWEHAKAALMIRVRLSEFTVRIGDTMGTADLLIDISEDFGDTWETLIVDSKSSRSIWPEHKMQLGILSKATHYFEKVPEGTPGAALHKYTDPETKKPVKTYWLKKPMPHFDGAAILHIREDSWELIRVNNLDLHAKRFSIYRQDWDLKKELKDLGD